MNLALRYTIYPIFYVKKEKRLAEQNAVAESLLDRMNDIGGSNDVADWRLAMGRKEVLY